MLLNLKRCQLYDYSFCSYCCLDLSVRGIASFSSRTVQKFLNQKSCNLLILYVLKQLYIWSRLLLLVFRLWFFCSSWISLSIQDLYYSRISESSTVLYRIQRCRANLFFLISWRISSMQEISHHLCWRLSSHKVWATIDLTCWKLYLFSVGLYLWLNYQLNWDASNFSFWCIGTGDRQQHQ